MVRGPFWSLRETQALIREQGLPCSASPGAPPLHLKGLGLLSLARGALGDERQLKAAGALPEGKRAGFVWPR